MENFIPDNQFVPDQPAAQQSGDKPAGFVSDSAFKSDESVLQEQYGTPSQQALTALEGASQGLLGPAATFAEKMAGIPAEDIAKRKEANPITHGVSEAAGIAGGVLTDTGLPALAGQAGAAVAKLAPLTSRIGQGAIRAATEMAVFQGGNEASKMIMNDPNQTLDSAIANVGLAGALGAVGGGLLATPGALWDSVTGSKLGGMIEDFKGRINYHLGEGEPVSNVVKELEDHYQALKESLGENSFTKSSIHNFPAHPDAPLFEEASPKIEGLKADLEPHLKAFEKEFTTDVNGLRSIDPLKVTEYMQDLGTPGARSRKEVLSNFLDSSTRYGDEMYDPNHIIPSDLHLSRLSTDELSPGAKLADTLVDKSMAKLISHGSAAIVGGTLGKLSGIPLLGALVGERALGPLFESALPALAKSILDAESNPIALKNAIDYALQAAKGLKKIGDVATSVVEKKSLDLVNPDKDTLKKLDDKVIEYQLNPQKALDASGQLQHYLPDHAGAVGFKIGAVASYLSTQRPDTSPMGPLGKPRPVSAGEKAQWERTLSIAQQPLMTMKLLSQNRLTSKDIKDLDSMYPAVAGMLRQKMIDQVLKTHSEGGKISYENRLQMSQFLGQSLDQSLAQPSMASAQSAFAPEQPVGPQASPKAPSAAKTSALKGLSTLASLPSQSRAQRRQIIK